MSLSYQLVKELSIRKYKKAKAKTIVSLIQERLKKRFDIRIVVTGEAGIGKSTIVLDIAELLDKQFVDDPSYAVKNKVHYSGLDYLKAMKTESAMSLLMMDESGQAMHHREFMSDVNVILSKTLQGNRFKRFIQVFCIPVLEMLDKDARYLVQLLIHVNERGDAEVFRVIVPKLEGKIWYKKIRDHYRFGKPNRRLWRIYERKKMQQQDKLYDSFIKELSERDKPIMTYEQLKQKALDNRTACMKGVKWNVKRMQAFLEVSRDKVEVVKALIDQEDDDI